MNRLCCILLPTMIRPSIPNRSCCLRRRMTSLCYIQNRMNCLFRTHMTNFSHVLSCLTNRGYNCFRMILCCSRIPRFLSLKMMPMQVYGMPVMKLCLLMSLFLILMSFWMRLCFC